MKYSFYNLYSICGSMYNFSKARLCPGSLRKCQNPRPGLLRSFTANVLCVKKSINHQKVVKKYGQVPTATVITVPQTLLYNLLHWPSLEMAAGHGTLCLSYCHCIVILSVLLSQYCCLYKLHTLAKQL